MAQDFHLTHRNHLTIYISGPTVVPLTIPPKDIDLDPSVRVLSIGVHLQESIVMDVHRLHFDVKSV